MSSPLTLAERHRKRQIALSSEALKQITPLWALLRAGVDPDDPTSVLDWSDAVMVAILSGRQQSTTAAHSYYEAAKKLEFGSTAEAPVLDDIQTTPNTERLRTSLLAVGPGLYRQRVIRGDDPELAIRKAQAATLGASVRHVLDGGRSLIDSATRTDGQALGWTRVTDGNPCAFCAMLATRASSVLYASRTSAITASGARGNRAQGSRYHDNCRCTAMPVFTPDFELPPDVDKWDQLYSEVTKGHSGKDALNAFRRAFEAQKREH